MRHPNPDILLRTAQADAFCMATEYIKFPRDQAVQEAALRFERYVKHPTHALKAGQFTDDTQMATAVSEVLLAGDLSKEAFAEAFVRCFARDKRDGYSRGFQAFLEDLTKDGYREGLGLELLRTIKSDSDKNGAAMRSVPLGVLPTVDQVLRAAETQAKITHDTPDGILSSQAVALMSYYALQTDEPFWKMWMFLDDHLKEFTPHMKAAELEHWPFRVAAPRVGIQTAKAVYMIIATSQVNNKGLVDLLRDIIVAGGDTDSVAAIAWGIASTRMPGPEGDWWEHGLETGRPYGPEFLKKLGAELMEKYA